MRSRYTEKQSRFFWAQTSPNFKVDDVPTIRLQDDSKEIQERDKLTLLEQVRNGETLGTVELFYSRSGDSIIPAFADDSDIPLSTHRERAEFWKLVNDL